MQYKKIQITKKWLAIWFFSSVMGYVCAMFVSSAYAQQSDPKDTGVHLEGIVLVTRSEDGVVSSYIDNSTGYMCYVSSSAISCI